MNILITGGTGFIGNELTKKLSLTRHNLIILHRKKIKNLYKKNKKIKYIKFDLLKDSLREKKLPKFNVIIHIAGMSSGLNKNQDYLINEQLTYSALCLMNENVKKFIHISSQSVYGNPQSLNIKETHHTDPGFSAYSCSKVNSENWLKTIKKNFNADFFSLRFSGFVEGGGVIKYIKENAEKNLPIELYSKGNVYRDYISISDGVNAIIATLKNKNSNSFIPINIGSGQQCSIKDLALFIRNTINSNSKIKLIKRNASLGNLTLNITKAQKMLKYKPNDIYKSIEAYIVNK